MPADDRVYVDGLRVLHGQLRDLDKELAAELRADLKQVADKAAQRMRAVVPVDPSPKRKGVAEHWRDKISAGASSRAAYVTWGRKTVPYAGWLEFGGARRGRGGGVAKRPFAPDGRFIYPQVEKARPELEQELRATLEKALQRVGLD